MPRKRSPNYCRRKGNNFELEIVHKLNELGFNTKTSRSESREKDAQKIDICDLDNTMPCFIQAKYLLTTPNYFEIESACPDKTKPFTIIWKKSGKDGKKSPGTIVMMPLNFFYELIKPYAGKITSDVSESK